MESPGIVRQVREAAGLSQRELARRLGVAQPSVARLETAGADPKLSTLEKTLNAMGYALIVHAVRTEAAVDEGQIRERLRLTPRERLDLFQSSAAALQRLTAGARRVP